MTSTTTTMKNNNNNKDLVALRSYVTAQDHDASRTNPNVIVADLTHSNLKQQHLEIRFDKSATVSDVAAVIHRKTGTPVRDQYLQVILNESNVVYETATPDNDRTPLLRIGLLTSTENCQQKQNQRIHCLDTNPYSKSANGGLENVNLVQKFELSDKEYDALPNTVRAYKKKEKEKQEKQQGGDIDNSTEQQQHHTRECVEPFLSQIGSRCEVQPGGRRGKIAWVGELTTLNKKKNNKGGWWIGIVLDEPVGQNDGSLNDKQYFECLPKHGCFVKASNVTVGDYPELDDIFDSDDSDDDDDDNDDEI